MAINNRPLAYVSDEDMDKALTPYQLMHDRDICKPVQTLDFVASMNLGECKRRVHHVCKLLRDCWVRFRDTYMNELRQMNMYRQAKGGRTRRISVGEVCYIKEDGPSVRTQWKKGKVVELVVGNDGMIRGARLKVLSNSGQQSNVYRPLQKLIPFEIRETSEGQADSKGVEDGGEEEAEKNEHSDAAEEQTNSRRPL